MTREERKKQLEEESLSKFCLEFLKSPLVIDPDYELENENDPKAYKTEDDAFYFVPQLDDPEMSGRTLRGQHPIPGCYRYSIEVAKCYGGSYWEPPDYDMVEIGRADNLYQAIRLAATLMLEQYMDAYSEGDYYSNLNTLDNEFPPEDIMFADF